MIVEKRVYRMHSGRMKDYLKAFESGGFAMQQKHLGACVGFYVSETGPIEEVTQMFVFSDWADREARRKALYADSQFQAVSDPLWPMIAEKHSQILRPAWFWKPNIES